MSLFFQFQLAIYRRHGTRVRSVDYARVSFLYRRWEMRTNRFAVMLRARYYNDAIFHIDVKDIRKLYT